MLHKHLIIKGPESNYRSTDGCHLGKFLIDWSRKKNPDKIFCVDGETGQTLTNSQFVNEALKLAQLLRQLGVQKGDVVAIITKNSIKYTVIATAILYIGAAINPLNPAYSIGELRHVFEMAKPKLIFCSTLALEKVQELKEELLYIRHIILTDKLSELEQDNNLVGIDTLDVLLDNIDVDPNSIQPAECDSKKDTAIIFLSSGTTGFPKGVMLTHANLCHPLGYTGQSLFLGPGKTSKDIGIAVLPFFHIVGFMPILVALIRSVKLIVLPSFRPESFLRCIQDYNVTTMYAVPPIVNFLLKHPLVKEFDISSLRILVCAGGTLGQETQDAIHKSFPNVIIFSTYGLTEMSGACTTVAQGGGEKVGSVGRLMPDLEAMIWNANLGENVGPLEIGELCFKGPMVMKGYIGNENTDIDECGFYHTGDTGYYDEDGCFYIVGRIKELIKYKGFQVAPSEIEGLLLKHPAVKDCGVIGIPDEKVGELPAAFIVCQNNASVSADDIIKYIAERISIHKQLHGGVRFTGSIPRNATGKILRGELLELFVR